MCRRLAKRGRLQTQGFGQLDKLHSLDLSRLTGGEGLLQQVCMHAANLTCLDVGHLSVDAACKTTINAGCAFGCAPSLWRLALAVALVSCIDLCQVSVAAQCLMRKLPVGPNGPRSLSTLWYHTQG